MRWQQRLRIGIAIFGVGFLVVLWYAVRAPAPREQAREKVERMDRSATAESTSGEVRRLGGKDENAWVEYDRMLAYPDGRQKLTGARAYSKKRGGRDFKVTANEADVSPNQDNVQMRGAVELATSDGLVAKTEEAAYSQSEGIVRAAGPMQFTRVRVSGSSVGMTYDEHRDFLWLLDQAVVKMAPETPADKAVDITSGTAGFARADHYVRYERGFQLVSGTRTLTSDLATAYLSDDGARVETLEMRGRSRITGVGDGVGAIRAMESDDVNLEFAEDGRTLRGATLSSAKPNRATIDVGTTDSGERRVAGQWIDVRIAPDGTTVTSLTVRDDVELALPATKDGPARTVRASALTAKGEAGKPLNGARFLDAVEFRETRTGVAARIVRSRSLDILTQPGFGAIDDAHFVGSVRFEADQLRATAGEARYLVTKGVVDLTGLDETTGQPPRVTDGQVTIDARRLEITLEGSKIHAQQDVRSIMASATQSPSKGAEGKTRRAGMLKQDQPVFATGADLTYDSVARLAVYTAVAPAQARLWQGDTAIQGARIEVDDAKGNLSAKGKVASTLQLDQGDAAPAKADHVATIASADELLYEDASRKTTYSGTAHVAGTNGDVRAAKVELYLKPAGNELERVEAYTTVSMVDATRTATGDRLTYLTETGRYLMSGAPVKLVADCRETTGRILTFFKSTNNIIVDPNDETRTQTKPVPGCVPAGRN